MTVFELQKFVIKILANIILQKTSTVDFFLYIIEKNHFIYLEMCLYMRL